MNSGLMRIGDLEPASARLCLDIKKICERRLGVEPGQKLLLAVSGGADSIALALIFSVIAPMLKIAICAAHIDHSLRPGSAQDATFVANFCAKNDIDFSMIKADARERAELARCGLEEAGRHLRLEILGRERARANADFIAVGHHKGDLAEDIIMRLTRGAAWPAAGGMGWKSGDIIRPLLHTDPAALRSFLIACGYSWREDESNKSLAFKRNRVRHIALPMLRCENPDLDSGLARFHDLAQLDGDYWERELDSELARAPWQVKEVGGKIAILLPRPLLAPMHPAARMRLYHRALKKLRGMSGGKGQSRADALFRLDHVFASGIGGKIIQCSGGISALCGKDGVLFQSGGK